MDKLRLLCDKIGVVRYSNKQVIITHHINVSIITASVDPIQAGVFWNHVGWGGTLFLLFLLYLWSNYNQTWHDDPLGQILSKAIKILMTSSPGGQYDVIKLFLVSYQVKIRFSLSFVQWG